jgi:hypothetical protein
MYRIVPFRWNAGGDPLGWIMYGFIAKENGSFESDDHVGLMTFCPTATSLRSDN